MNILIPDSWLREFLETEATPQQLAECLSLCGPSVEKINQTDDDFIYNIEVTTNRVDMMSVIGIAQEAAAILPQFGIDAEFKPPSLDKPGRPAKRLELTIEDPQHLCHRLLGVVLDNVSLKASPKKISKRLNTAGIRSLNNAIDITNYVMTEIGHPTHVFDYDRIKTHKLILRKARGGETIITLEGKKYALTGEDVVIDDGTGRIIDLPGIIGTKNSVVTENTKRVLFFTENNNPINIRKTSMRLGIRTTAATINEKDVDPELAEKAILRGLQLFKGLTGAQVASNLIDIYPQPYRRKTVSLSLEKLREYLKVNLKSKKVETILKSLGFEILRQTKGKLEIAVPSWRSADISIPEDLIEEVARVYGYHNLPSILPAGKLPEKPVNQIFALEDKVKKTLADWGYTEVYTYSAQSQPQLLNCSLDPKSHLKITNPLSEEWVYLRTSLIPSILEVIAKNQGFQEKIKIFEMANVYLPKKGKLPDEKLQLIVAQTGKNQFYQLKGVMESLFEKLGVDNYKLEPLEQSKIFNTNKTAKITIGLKTLAIIGEISRRVIVSFDIETPLLVLELDFELLSKIADSNKTFIPLPEHPPIIEDLTFVLKSKTYLQDLIQLIKESSLIIKRVALVDSYRDNRTLRITYQHPERNLTDKEVEQIRDKIIRKARLGLQAKIKSL